MAQCGTTEVCQIMPRYLKVRSHLSRTAVKTQFIHKAAFGNT